MSLSLKKKTSNVIKKVTRYGKEIFDNFMKYVSRLTTVVDVNELGAGLKKNLNGIIAHSTRSIPTNKKPMKR